MALVVQAAGGAMASSANTPSGSKLGANVMLGGIVFQLCEKSQIYLIQLSFWSFPASRNHGVYGSYIWVHISILLQKTFFWTRNRDYWSYLDSGFQAAADARCFGFEHCLHVYSVCIVSRLMEHRPWKTFSAIYRTIELAGGWNGRIISTELYFRE